jgi:hypothetical protein
MRFLVGILIGIILGSTTAAFASFITMRTWNSNTSDSLNGAVHLGYVLDVLDTAAITGTLNEFSTNPNPLLSATPRAWQTALVSAADCVNKHSSEWYGGAYLNFAESVMSNPPYPDVNAAYNIVLTLAKCPSIR